MIRDWRNEYPPYFIVGPVVFCEARSEMISGLTKVRGGPEWLMWLIVSGNPLTRQAGEKQEFPGQRLVYISSPFFPHKLSKGYGTPVLRVIQSVNNQPAKNLSQFVQLIRDSTDEFLRFEFAGRGGETLVFPRKEMIESTDAILNDNGIRSQGSPELLAIWNAHPPK